MQTATIFLAVVGAATALVAREPAVAFDQPGVSLISYRPYCPVCDTVALNAECLSAGASCRSSNYLVGGAAATNPKCETGCNKKCQQIPYTANSDTGYTCNVTRTA